MHPAAADALVDAVMELADPRPGEHLVDLYAGVGLFAGVWGSARGDASMRSRGTTQPLSTREANLADLDRATVHAGRR